MVSDAELVQRLREFLRSSDLSTTTTGTVRRQLESDFNVDLSDKKAFIREQVDRFLSELENERKEQGGEEQEEEEEEEEEEEGVKEEEEEEQEEEEESSEEDGGSSRKRGSNKNSKEVKRGGGGFTKLCTLSPQLHEFIGEPELARTEVVKRLWAYIRENSLQDPSNKRKILCDERLQGLFNVKSIDMFQMNKALSKHIWPLNSEEAPPVKTTQKEKQHKKDKATDGSPRKRKRQPGGNYGFLAPLQLSDALVKFIGTGENELPRSDVIKRIWNHIKENNLQDPANKRNIICDEKLKELFQVDSFTGFTVSKLLGGHLTKAKQ